MIGCAVSEIARETIFALEFYSIVDATYFKNFVAMKRRDNLNCCKNIKTDRKSVV